MTDRNILAAWDGMFTVKQWDAIRQMSVYADKKSVKLHEAIVDRNLAPRLKQNNKEVGFIKKPIRKCPKCGGVLKLFSVHTKESAVYKSKWECCKTCKGSGCGYKEYSTKESETIIEEAGNGSTK